MKKLDLSEIKNVWRYKLTHNFDSDKEHFNIYIDSPFCTPPKCKFCIYKPTIMTCKEDVEFKNKYYEELLVDEIREFSDILKIRQPDAAYFGGGTSSLMTIPQMKKIFEELNKHFDFKGMKEKNFELNPLSATDDKIDLLLEWNFTHISFGYQTCNEEVLKFNNRLNVSIDRLKQIFKKLEDADIKYNIDILTFIYRDNLEEDMLILKKDLEIMKELQPRRITIFPNYKYLNKSSFSKYYSCDDIENNTSISEEDKKLISEITVFRELVADFCEKYKYKNITKNFKDKSKGLFLPSNPQLVRKDLSHVKWKIYNSSTPESKVYLKNDSLLAFGGYDIRRPYSYINDKYAYYNRRSKDKRWFEPIRSRITVIQ